MRLGLRWWGCGAVPMMEWHRTLGGAVLHGLTSFPSSFNTTIKVTFQNAIFTLSKRGFELWTLIYYNLNLTSINNQH